MPQGTVHEARGSLSTERGPEMAAEINLRWEDPPNNMSRGTAIDPNAPEFQELRANPKRWARLYDYPNGGSAQSRASSLRKTLGSNFEIVSRKMGDGGGTAVFGRYVETPQG